MAQTALSAEDRTMAIIVWVCMFFGGPIATGALLAANWNRPDSLARRHAILATTVSMVLLAIWVPIVLSQLILPSFFGGADPGIWIIFVGGAIMLLLLVCSGAGIVSAARATVAPRIPSH